MSKRNWKNIKLLSCCERSKPNFLGKNWLLYLLICCIHSNFQFKIHRTRNQGLPTEISRKVPYIQGLFKDKFIFKDFSRKTQNSRTFQGLWEPCNHYQCVITEVLIITTSKFPHIQYNLDNVLLNNTLISRLPTIKVTIPALVGAMPGLLGFCLFSRLLKKLASIPSLALAGAAFPSICKEVKVIVKVTRPST